MLPACAANACPHDYDVWVFSPRVDGLVPACVPHHMDVVAGAVTLDTDVPVLERGVRA